MLKRTLILFSVLFFLLSSVSFASSTTGLVEFIDASGRVVQGYQHEDEVWLRVTDADANLSSSKVDTVAVLVTSTTENQGTKASASKPTSGSNVGGGVVEVIEVGEWVKSENWELLAIDSDFFIVKGSISGELSSRLVVGRDYRTADGQLILRVTQEGALFSAGDSFTFNTTKEQLTGEVVLLEETDLNTGVFKGFIHINSDGNFKEENGVLDVMPGDRLTVEYYDALNDWGAEERVRGYSLVINTLVIGGSLFGDVVWRPEHSPYFVTGDISIDEQSSLTLLAGTQVLFIALGDDKSSGDDVQRSELLVQGRLSIKGTESQPVLLSSVRRGNHAKHSDWGGVRLFGDNAYLDMEHADFHFSAYGIRWFQVGRDTSQKILESRFIDNYHSVVFAEGCSSCDFLVKGNEIVNSIHPMTFDYAGHVSIINNRLFFTANTGRFERVEKFTFLNNKAYKTGPLIIRQARGDIELSRNVLEIFDGVILEPHNVNGEEQNVESILIQNNLFIAERWSTQAGVYAAFKGDFLGRLLVSDNYIEGFSNNPCCLRTSGGIHLRMLSKGGIVEILDNEIKGIVTKLLPNEGNGQYGIHIQGYGYALVKGNKIQENSIGLYFNGYGSEPLQVDVFENLIINNREIGVALHGSAQPILNRNDIYDNGHYALVNNTSNIINARNNWWGEAAQEELSSGGHPKSLSFIYDGFNQAGYGNVNYSGFLINSVWYIPEYTVSFVDWDNQLISTVKVKQYQSAVAPEAPKRPGYTFSGWSAMFNNVTADLTITAQFVANDYLISVIVQGDGGVVSPAQRIVRYGETIIFSLIPAKGYKPAFADGCEGYLQGNSYLIERVTGDCSVTVTFKVRKPKKRNMLLFLLVDSQSEQN